MHTSRADPDDLLRYRPFVSRLARRLVADPHEAADVEQQSWLRALRHPPSHRRALRSWLGTIVRNVAHSRFQAEGLRRHARLEEHVADPGAPRPGDGLRVDAARQELAGALRRLGEPYAETIRLRYYEELPLSEIARRQAVPVETVRTRLRRGLERLRASLDRANGGRRREWSLLPFVLGRASRRALSWPSLGGLALVGTAGLALAVVLFGGRASRRAAEPVATLDRQREAIPTGSALEAPVAPTRTPPPVEAPAEDAELEVRLVERASGAGVAGLAVELRALAGEALESSDPPRSGITGEGGALRFADLTPGLWRLAAERGRAARAWLGAGEERTLTIELERAVSLVGVVEDAGGEPVADAELWVSRPADPWQGEVLCRSDPAGGFRLHGLDPEAWIGARLEGRRPSRLRLCGDAARSSEPLVLALREGARGAGIVVDENGRALEGVRIQVIPDEPYRPRFARDGTLSLQPVNPSPVTDREGRYECSSFLWRRSMLVASKPGYATHRQPFHLLGGEGELRGQGGSHVVVLERAEGVEERPAVRGVALSPEGEPFAGARVVARPSGGEDSPLAWLTGGSWGTRETVADERGSFAVALREGERSLDLFLHAPGEQHPPLASARDVRPGELVLRAGEPARGSLVGRLESAAPSEAVVLLASPALSAALPRRPDAGGAFRFDDVPAGRCALSVLTPTRLSPLLACVDAVEAEVRDVGVLVLDDWGRIELAIHPPGEEELGPLYVSCVLGDRGCRVRSGRQEGSWSLDEAGRFRGRVPAGTHAFTVGGPGYADRSLELEVGEGETVRAEVVLERGRQRWIVVLGAGHRLRALVRDAAGRLLASSEEPFVAGEARVSLRMPEGLYTLELERDGEQALSMPISFAPHAGALRLSLDGAAPSR